MCGTYNQFLFQTLLSKFSPTRVMAHVQAPAGFGLRLKKKRGFIFYKKKYVSKKTK